MISLPHTPQPDATDFRLMALEHLGIDLDAVAQQSAAFREMTHMLLGMVAEEQRQNASLQRQLQAMKDEYQAHRERTMRAALPPEHAASLSLDESEPRTYTTKHGTYRNAGPQYVPIVTGAATTAPLTGPS